MVDDKKRKFNWEREEPLTSSEEADAKSSNARYAGYNELISNELISDADGRMASFKKRGTKPSWKERAKEMAHKAGGYTKNTAIRAGGYARRGAIAAGGYARRGAIAGGQYASNYASLKWQEANEDIDRERALRREMRERKSLKRYGLGSSQSQQTSSSSSTINVPETTTRFGQRSRFEQKTERRSHFGRSSTGFSMLGSRYRESTKKAKTTHRIKKCSGGIQVNCSSMASAVAKSSGGKSKKSRNGKRNGNKKHFTRRGRSRARNRVGRHFERTKRRFL